MEQIRLSIVQTSDAVVISIPKELIEVSKHDDVNLTLRFNEDADATKSNEEGE